MRTVLVHFEVEEDYVLLDTFVASAAATARSVKALNEQFFGDHLTLEIVVFAPAHGSLRQYIGVTVKVAKKTAVGAGALYAFLWSLIQLMDSPTVQEVTKELLGATPSQLLVEKIRDFRSRSESQNITEADARALQQESIELVEEILVENTSTALAASPDLLDSATFPPELGYELRMAQSELFSAALEDQNVRSIGFDEDEPLPIPRNQFAIRGVRPLPPRKDEEDEEEWQVNLQQIRITSPVFEREEPQRKWMGKDVKGSTLLFDIVDADFWNRLMRGDFKFSEGSEILAQMASRVGRRGPRERKVLRVLKLDGAVLAEPLDENATSSILGRLRPSTQDGDQGGLF